MTLTFNPRRVWIVIHTDTKHTLKGQSVQQRQYEQTDGRTDRRYSVNN